MHCSEGFQFIIAYESVITSEAKLKEFNGICIFSILKFQKVFNGRDNYRRQRRNLCEAYNDFVVSAVYRKNIPCIQRTKVQKQNTNSWKLMEFLNCDKELRILGIQFIQIIDNIQLLTTTSWSRFIHKGSSCMNMTIAWQLIFHLNGRVLASSKVVRLELSN